jgi:hypothetical protein
MSEAMKANLDHLAEAMLQAVQVWCKFRLSDPNAV